MAASDDAREKARASEGACCACLTVAHEWIHNPDGTMSERWFCPMCQTSFMRVPATLREIATALAERDAEWRRSIWTEADLSNARVGPEDVAAYRSAVVETALDMRDAEWRERERELVELAKRASGLPGCPGPPGCRCIPCQACEALAKLREREGS